MIEKPHEHEEVWTDADHTGETDDEWHRHTTQEGEPQHAHGQTTPGMIALVGIGGFATLVLTIGFVHLFFNQVNRAKYVEHVEKVPLPTEQQSWDAKARWEAVLRGYEWVDPQKNVVSIPIDRAMDAVIKDFQAHAK